MFYFIKICKINRLNQKTAIHHKEICFACILNLIKDCENTMSRLDSKLGKIYHLDYGEKFLDNEKHYRNILLNRRTCICHINMYTLCILFIFDKSRVCDLIKNTAGSFFLPCCVTLTISLLSKDYMILVHHVEIVYFSFYTFLSTRKNDHIFLLMFHGQITSFLFDVNKMANFKK